MECQEGLINAEHIFWDTTLVQNHSIWICFWLGIEDHSWYSPKKDGVQPTKTQPRWWFKKIHPTWGNDPIRWIHQIVPHWWDFWWGFDYIIYWDIGRLPPWQLWAWPTQWSRGGVMGNFFVNRESLCRDGWLLGLAIISASDKHSGGHALNAGPTTHARNVQAQYWRQNPAQWKGLVKRAYTTRPSWKSPQRQKFEHGATKSSPLSAKPVVRFMVGRSWLVATRMTSHLICQEPAMFGE